MRESRMDGFTLIEVLVVVAIIALLISILLPSLAAARAATRSTVCQNNLHQAGVAVTMYSLKCNDYVPRGNAQRYWSHGHIHWTIVLARHLGINLTGIFEEAQLAGTSTGTFAGRTWEMRGIKLNELLWRRFQNTPVFHCPERARDTGAEAVSYVVNKFPSPARGPGGQSWNDLSHATRLSEWKLPGQTIYLAELEKSSIAPSVANFYNVNGSGIGDLSALDVTQTGHLPSGAVLGLGNDRLVARFMHARRRINCLFMDGHAEAVDSLPRGHEIITQTQFQPSYTERWLGLFGVRAAIPGS